MDWRCVLVPVWDDCLELRAAGRRGGHLASWSRRTAAASCILKRACLIVALTLFYTFLFLYKITTISFQNELNIYLYDQSPVSP